MTGTSLDGLDAALVEIDGTGLAMRARFVRAVSRPLGDLGAGLRRLAEQEPMAAGAIAQIASSLAFVHAEVLGELAGDDRLDLACVHGQTLFHAPPLSWQLMQPALIARAIRAPVVFDLRAADLAAGGQGAPITPLADWVLFRGIEGSLAVANLGGFCNVTILPRPEADAALGGIEGFDVCPCNQVLDAIARRLLGRPFDEGGASALGGHVHEEALEDLDGIMASLAGRRRSMGTGDEAIEWVSRWRAHGAPADLGATACEAIGQRIARAARGAHRILLAGGGVRNTALVRAIASCSSCRVEPTDGHGVPAAYREAICMAVLGALCQDRVPITLPRVTGCAEPAPVAGAWVFP